MILDMIEGEHPLEVQITLATAEDTDGIQQLMRASVMKTYTNEKAGITAGDIEDLYSDEFTPEATKDLAKSLSEPEAGVKSFVAKDNGRVIGYCRVKEGDDENQLIRIHVLSDRKHSGIGTALWKQAQRSLNPSKNTSLWVVDYNENAIRIYRKWGFEEVEGDVIDEPLKSGSVRRSIKMLLPTRVRSN
jgi:ribosomal protein S18 acetylase RimI-like enzyme